MIQVMIMIKTGIRMNIKKSAGRCGGQNEGRRFIEQADPGKMNRIKKEAVFL